MALAEEFDIILMDIEMSVTDGETATKELIKGGYSLPIMTLSANAILEDMHRYKKLE